MDTILLTILILLLLVTIAILYLNIRSKPRNDSKESEEIANLNAEIVRLKDSLKTTINTSLGSMSTSFNALSTGVTKDMTEALTKVDEKVGNFNQQVQLLMAYLGQLGARPQSVPAGTFRRTTPRAKPTGLKP